MKLIKTILTVFVICLFLYIIGALTLNDGKITISTAAVVEFTENTKELINDIRGIKDNADNMSITDIAKQGVTAIKD